MGMSILCPWCHETNDLPRTGAVYCKKCAHRADTHPQNCDCLNCAPPPWAPEFLPDLAPLLPPVLEPENLPATLPDIPPLELPPLENVIVSGRGVTAPDIREVVSRVGVEWRIDCEDHPEFWFSLSVTREHLVRLVCQLVPDLGPQEIWELRNALSQPPIV